MKKILLALALMAAAPQIQAKEKDAVLKEVLTLADNGRYQYESVVNIENVAKEEMYKRAKQWVIANLKTVDNNIQFDESEYTIVNNPIVTIKAAGGLTWAITRGAANFKVNLQFRDGRYKILVDNVSIYLEHGPGIPPNTFAYELLMKDRGSKAKTHVMKEVNEQINAIAVGIEQAVKGNPGNAANDNW